VGPPPWLLLTVSPVWLLSSVFASGACPVTTMAWLLLPNIKNSLLPDGALAKEKEMVLEPLTETRLLRDKLSLAPGSSLGEVMVAPVPLVIGLVGLNNALYWTAQRLAAVGLPDESNVVGWSKMAKATAPLGFAVVPVPSRPSTMSELFGSEKRKIS